MDRHRTAVSATTMSLKLACPRCHHVQFFDDALAGQPVACAKCAQAFRVPRGAEPAAAEAVTPAAAFPWPDQMQARELPTSFAPPEPPAFHVVPLADAEPGPARKRFADDDDVAEVRPVSATAMAEPVRRAPHPVAGRARLRRDEAPRLPWGVGVAIIAIVMALFIGAAVWFLARDHNPPQKRIVFGGPQPPFQQPQFQQPMQPPFPPQAKMRPMPRNMLEQDNWAMLREGMMMPIAPQPNEQFIPVKLEQKKLRQPGQITLNDPTHPLNPKHHRKVYLVDLEARTYTFEMHVDPPRNMEQKKKFVQKRDLDPFLIIQDSQGKLLKSNDDKEIAVFGGGHDMNSWIPFYRIPAAGTYRITCTSFAPGETGGFILHIRDEDVGKPVAAKNILADRKVPLPTETKQALEVEKTVKRNLNITTIFTSDEPLVGDLCWADDLSAFFVLDKKGTLRRIAWPDLVEERRLDMAMPPSALALSARGLLVSFPQLEEVWVVDPQRLHLHGRISAPGLQHVAATAASDIAVVASKQKANPLPKDVLMVLDVAKGSAVRQYDNYSPRHAVMSADGKFVFAEGAVEQLVRYRVQGDEVLLDEESPRLAAKGQGVFVSPDGKYVCLPSPGGNQSSDPARELEQYTTLIFQSDNLRKPAFAINTGESPRAVGFDPKSGNIFAHNNEKQFMLFRENGFKSREINLPGADQFSGQPRQFLTHPAGFQVLVRTEHTVYGVELPKDEEK